MITLSADRLQLTIDPAHGGVVTSFARDDGDILRAVGLPSRQALGGTRAAGLALLPYVDRIGHGRFAGAQGEIQLATNITGSPHPADGVGWMRSWEVVSADTRAAMLRLRHGGDADWPYAFTATQSFGLSRTGLTLGLAITHDGTRGQDSMPACLGYRLHLARSPQCELAFAADALWENDAAMLPRQLRDIDPYADFSQGQALMSADFFDGFFAGWSGAASVLWPETGMRLRLQADPQFAHLGLFTPPAQDMFALTPASAMANAVNHAAARELRPGETLRGTLSLTLEQV